MSEKHGTQEAEAPDREPQEGDRTGPGGGLATAAAASLAAGASYVVAKRVMRNRDAGPLKQVGSKVKDVGSNVGSKVKDVASRGDQEGSSNGDGSSRSRSSDSLRSAIESMSWGRAQDLAVPLAERAASAAGEFVAREAPEVVTDRLIPRFISAFEKARSKNG